MKCNCSNWDDESPCPFHKPKMKQSPMVEHSVIVIRVYRAHATKKWLHTITKDGIRVKVSGYFDTQKEATPI